MKKKLTREEKDLKSTLKVCAEGWSIIFIKEIIKLFQSELKTRKNDYKRSV